MSKTQDVWIDNTPGRDGCEYMPPDQNQALRAFLTQLFNAPIRFAHVEVHPYEDGGFNVVIIGAKESQRN